MNLKYCVITSVTRDDLPDGGAEHFKKCIDEIRKICDAKIEILTPDFKGKKEAFVWHTEKPISEKIIDEKATNFSLFLIFSFKVIGITSYNIIIAGNREISTELMIILESKPQVCVSR